MEFRGEHVFLFDAVHLVDDHQHGLARAAQVRGKVFVEGQQPFASVHHEADGDALGNGLFGLPQDFGLEPADARRAFGHGGMSVEGDAPGVDDAEWTLVATTHDAFHAFAGDARHVVRDGAVAAYQAVEEGRLADVGSAHECYLGEHMRFPADGGDGRRTGTKGDDPRRWYVTSCGSNAGRGRGSYHLYQYRAACNTCETPLPAEGLLSTVLPQGRTRPGALFQPRTPRMTP